MRSSNNSKQLDGKSEPLCSGTPIENGPSTKEDGDSKDDDCDADSDVRAVAAKVVENVVKMAAIAAQSREDHLPSQGDAESKSKREKIKPLSLQRLPTIQIDTVPSMPPSPCDSLHEEQEPIDESQIELELTEKLTFADQAEAADRQESSQADLSSISVSKEQQEVDEKSEAEIRSTASEVVSEVIDKAIEMASEKMAKEAPSFTFPGLPSIQIDTVVSVPPSPASDEDETSKTQTKWTFEEEKPKEAQENKTQNVPQKSGYSPLITYDEAPEDVKEYAANYVKDIVSKALSTAEEKKVPTVPFNFEDGDLMKTSGPWYIRAREALVRLLRTACFCTPRRNNS